MRLLRNTEVMSIAGSSPMEPSSAVLGNDVFFPVWRVFSLSGDGGWTFTRPSHGTPVSVFPERDEFVDQSAIWSPTAARVVWAMIRKPADGSGYVIRVAFTSHSDLVATKAKAWTYFDITPSQLGLAGQKLDYPQLAVGTGALYLTAQYGTTSASGSSVNGSLIVRFANGELESLCAGVVRFSFFVEAGIPNLGVAQRTRSSAVWAGHVSNTKIRVHRWDEWSNSITWQDVTMPGWNNAAAAYTSLTRDGHDWLSSEWGRITGALVSYDSAVFAWTAGATPPGRPNPYICLAQFSLGSSTTLSGRRDVFHRDHAWAVPTLATNTRGDLAMAAAWGGGQYFTNFSVGFVDWPISATSRYENITAAIGTKGDVRWGDFMSVRNTDVDTHFAATGYTVHPGESGSALANVSRYLVFTRDND